MLKMSLIVIIGLLFTACGSSEATPTKQNGMSKASYDRQNAAAKESHQGLNQD